MQRRRFLPLAAVALAGCVTGARDESGPRNPPTTPEGGAPATDGRDLRIVGGVPRERADGTLVLAITVENIADGRRGDTLVGIATVEGEAGTTEYEASEAVSLPGNSEREIELSFDVRYEVWAGNGGLSYGWDGEL